MLYGSKIDVNKHWRVYLDFGRAGSTVKLDQPQITASETTIMWEMCHLSMIVCIRYALIIPARIVLNSPEYTYPSMKFAFYCEFCDL